MVNAEKIKRAEQVNELIQLISSIDRRFFYCKSTNQVAQFGFNKKGRVYLIDDYSGKKVYPDSETRTKKEQGFSHGGTLWTLVRWLAEYIRIGESLYSLIDFKETWAYSYEGTMKVREKAVELGILEDSDYPYERWA